MQNLTLEELHRDLLELKDGIKSLQISSLEDHKVLHSLMSDIDRRLIKLEERVLLFSVLAGFAMGLLGELISNLFFE